MSDEDGPTTAAEMALMEELKRLMQAATENVAQEQVDSVNAGLLALVVNLHSVLDRAERVLELRRAKGYPGFSPATGDVLAQLYDRGRALANILEEL